MDGQQIGVGLLLAGALLYLGRATWQTWFGSKASCGSGCGTCAAKPVVDSNDTGRRIPLELTQK